MIKCSMSVMKKCLTIASSSSSSPIPIFFSVPSYSLFSELRFARAASFSIPASLRSAMCSSYKPPSGTRIPVPTRGLHSKAAGGFSPCGELHVVVGPMFAGKTTTLLRRMQSDMDSGRSVVVIKSNKDRRYGLDSIVTHDGLKLPCWALPNLSSFKKDFGQDAYDKLDVIGIDEAQFFDDLYEFCREAADHDGKKVVVAGLDGDYLRRSFGSVLDIIPLADSVTKLTARCELCGQRAFFTLRKTEERQTELIGGADMYMPVCRRHYVGGQVAVEVARVVTESQVAHCGAPV